MLLNPNHKQPDTTMDSMKKRLSTKVSKSISNKEPFIGFRKLFHRLFQESVDIDPWKKNIFFPIKNRNELIKEERENKRNPALTHFYLHHSRPLWSESPNCMRSKKMLKDIKTPLQLTPALQCTIIGPSWQNCSLVLCTCPMELMNQPIWYTNWRIVVADPPLAPVTYYSFI